MPSPAAGKFRLLRDEADALRKMSRLSRAPFALRQTLYRSSVVLLCAAWQAYIEELVNCFFDETSPFKVGTANPHHQLARGIAAGEVKRFKTPNSEITRNLLVLTTGYDPWPDWNWPSAGLNSIRMRSRVDEILKVRHSVAHGFSLPKYEWTISRAGNARLTAASLDKCVKCIAILVDKTDQGMSNHIQMTYRIRTGW